MGKVWEGVWYSAPLGEGARQGGCDVITSGAEGFPNIVGGEGGGGVAGKTGASSLTGTGIFAGVEVGKGGWD